MGIILRRSNHIPGSLHSSDLCRDLRCGKFRRLETVGPAVLSWLWTCPGVGPVVSAWLLLLLGLLGPTFTPQTLFYGHSWASSWPVRRLPGACIHLSDASSRQSLGFLDASNASWPLLGLALTCQTPPWGVYSFVRRRFQDICKPIWTSQTYLTSLHTDTTCRQYPWHMQIHYSVWLVRRRAASQ